MNEERFSTQPDAEKEEERTARDRLEGVLGFLRGDRTESDSNDENSEKRKKGKSKKWRRFLRAMFGGEQAPADDSEKPRSLFSPIISYEPLPAEPQSSELANKDSGEQSEVLASEEVVAGAESADIVSAFDEEPVASTAEQSLPSLEPDRASEHEPEVEQGVLHVEHDRAGDYRQAVELNSTPPPPEAPPITVRNATPALLAIDYLNHRARKKLEKRFEKDKSKSDADIRDLKKANDSLSRKAKESRSATPEAPKRYVADAKPRKVSSVAEALPKPESKDRPQDRTIVEKLVPTQVDREDPYRRAEVAQEKLRNGQEQRKVNHTEQSTSSETENEQLKEEFSNTFVEREYERRHEVRDEAGNDAVSVAEILKAKQLKKSYSPVQSPVQAVHQSATKSAAQIATPKNIEPNGHQPISYTSAITSGFIAGLVIFASLLALTIIR